MWKMSVLKDLLPIFCIQKIRKDNCSTKNKKNHFHFLPSEPIFRQQFTCTVQACTSRRSELYQVPEYDRMLVQELVRAQGEVSFIGQDVIQLLPEDQGR